MNFQFLLIALLCVSFAQAEDLSAPAINQHMIRVRIEHLKEEVVLKGRNIQINGEKLSSSGAKRKFAIHLLENGSWALRKVEKESDKPTDKLTDEKIFATDKLDITGDGLEISERAAPPHVVFSHTAKSLQALKFDAIAELPLEEYLLDVIASEVPSHWPLETLKAQAVAARSYALVIQKERADKPYHIDSSTQHQVFQYKQHKKVKNTGRIVKAVKQTRAQILVGSGGEIFKTYFHAHCGGETEDPGAVWGEPNPNFKPLKDKESCETSQSGQWKAEVKEREFLAYVQKGARHLNGAAAQQLDDNRFLSLSVKHKPDSERIETIEIATLKKTVVLRSQNFREAFGFTRIKSTIFTYTYKDGVFSFVGRGYGHGAGLCQTGSRWMGATGSNFKQILSRYYPDARLGLMSSNDAIILSKN